MSSIRETLESYKPELAGSYTTFISRQFAHMLESLGATLPNIQNSWAWANAWRNSLSFVAGKKEIARTLRGGVYEYFLDEDRLAVLAARYADDVVESWEGKILSKMGELEQTAVQAMSGLEFRITGTKNGNDVEIIQTVTVNVSKNGKVFNQFPARIKLNGKAISEAAFKKVL